MYEVRVHGRGNATLIHRVDVFAGLRPGGRMLINSRRTWAELHLDGFGLDPDRVVLLPASQLAGVHLGRERRDPRERPGQRAVTRGSLRAMLAAAAAGTLEPLAFLDLDPDVAAGTGHDVAAGAGRDVVVDTDRVAAAARIR